MKKINLNFLFKFLSISIIFLFPVLAKATSLEELRQQFISLGGSNEGFNKIIQVVEKSQAANKQLKTKIAEVYNKQFYDLMITENFNYEAYIQTYNNLEKEKYNLTNQNLNDMISLLNSLTFNDRKAYASLLYSVSKPMNVPTNTSTSSNADMNSQNVGKSINTNLGVAEQQHPVQNNTVINNNMLYDNSGGNAPMHNVQPNNTNG